MKRKKYQMPGNDEPLTIEDSISEVRKFKKLQLYSTWQTGVICYSSYPIGIAKMVDNNLEGKLRVLTFSIN